MKVLGLRLNAKKSLLSPLQRTTYLGVVWDLTRMQARMYPARIESILTEVRRDKEGQSLTVKQFQRLLGLMAAVSNVIPIDLLYMRPLQWWRKTKGFSPRGNSLCTIKVTWRCLHALDMRKKPWFLFMGADVLGQRAGEWMHHPKVVKQIWRVFGQVQLYLFATQETAQCPLWYTLVHPAPLGLDGMVHTWPRFRLYTFPPTFLPPGVLARVRLDEVSLLIVLFWPGRVWFLDWVSLLDDSPREIPVRRYLLSQAVVFHPRLELWKLWVWLIASGLSTEVVETILQSRAPSTRKLYALKWKLSGESSGVPAGLSLHWADPPHL